MKELKTLLNEVDAHLQKDTFNGDLPIENRVFIRAMLIFTDIIITHRGEIFQEVFNETLELEEAKLN